MNILDQNKQPYDADNLALHIEKALRVERPTQRVQDISYQVVKRAFRPWLIDVENVPDEPCLFVGNHSLFAFDGAVLGPVMYAEQGRFLRGLGDKFLWSELTEDFLLGIGGVLGHPEVCSALMENGSDLMVFPGGAHEATKTTAEKYTLMWKERYGFVRMAVQHGYNIMPVALVGPDDFYSHLMEGEDIPDSMLGQWLTRLGVLNENTRPDMLPPIPRGLLGSLLPRPQRCYIQFGKPVRTAHLLGKKPAKKTLLDIRARVATQIEEMLTDLLILREEDSKQQGLLRRLLNL